MSKRVHPSGITTLVCEAPRRSSRWRSSRGEASFVRKCVPGTIDPVPPVSRTYQANWRGLVTSPAAWSCSPSVVASDVLTSNSSAEPGPGPGWFG